MNSFFFFRCAKIINGVFPLCGWHKRSPLSTAGKLKWSQLNAAFRLIKHNVLYSTLVEILNLFTDCLGQDCQPWVDFSEWFKSELKEDQDHSGHTSFVGNSALQQLKTCQVFRERSIFRQQKKRSLWDQILDVHLWKLKKRGRSNIVFNNHLIFFFSQNPATQ